MCVLDREVVAHRSRLADQLLHPRRFGARRLECAPHRQQASLLGEAPGVDAERIDTLDFPQLLVGLVPSAERT